MCSKAEFPLAAIRILWILVGVFLHALTAGAQPTNYSLIYDFSLGVTNRGGFYYVRQLMEGRDHRLYGATVAGGAYSRGTVFSMRLDGTDYHLLHSFQGNPSDGASPEAGLIQASDGKLYGTTIQGGVSNWGTMFRLSADGSAYTVLHHFTGGISDGAAPRARLLESSDGRLYGTTYSGGTNGPGTVFAINKDGSDFAIVRSLTASATDAGYPEGPLMEGSDGAFYGVAASGGIVNSGALFKLERDGSYTVLHLYNDGADGAAPRDALLEGSNGQLYGTTRAGGTAGRGTIFRLNKNGTSYTVLHHFTGIYSEGASPDAALIEGRDGLLYGSTKSGGVYNSGTLFRIAKDGTGLAMLHHFTAGGDTGYYPQDGLISGSDGAFYGTAPGGHGSFDAKTAFGFIFRLGHGLGLSVIGSEVHLELTGIPGFNYEIQHSTDLSSWITLEALVMPESGRIDRQYPEASGEPGFFKLHVP